MSKWKVANESSGQQLTVTLDSQAKVVLLVISVWQTIQQDHSIRRALSSGNV